MSAGGWVHAAACRDADPELFFPTATDGELYATQVAAAKAMCAGCPVRAACLADACQRLPFGVAGGLDADERGAMRRAARRPGRDVGGSRRSSGGGGRG